MEKITILTWDNPQRPFQAAKPDITLFSGEIDPMNFEMIDEACMEVCKGLPGGELEVVIYNQGVAAIGLALVAKITKTVGLESAKITMMHFDVKSGTYMPQRLF